jgi:hypothetical protein
MPWGRLFDRPIFSLTSDQDWTPAWAADDLLSFMRKAQIPVHVFRTNPCPVFDAAAATGEITQGWHPNFLPNSSHGKETSEIIDYMRANFPRCRTVRSHTLFESTATWKALASAGIVADSQTATLYQENLVPLLHWSGMLRFPVYFVDDVFFIHEAPSLSLDALLSTLFTPGLKILNVHATFFACNVPSQAYYEEIRGRIFDTEIKAEGLAWTGRGTADVVEELLQQIMSRGYSLEGFETVVDMVFAHIKKNAADFPAAFGMLSSGASSS